MMQPMRWKLDARLETAKSIKAKSFAFPLYRIPDSRINNDSKALGMHMFWRLSSLHR